MSDISRLTPQSASIKGWRNPQNIRWSLRNFSFLPTIMVPRGDQLYELETGDARDIAQFEFEHKGKTCTLADAMRADSMDGYMVIKDNKIIYEAYFDNFRKTDHHLWASMTKSLVSTAFGIAAQRYSIDETKSPADYIPGLNTGVFTEVSIRQVLNMVTALDYTEDYENMTPGSVHFNYFRRLGLVPDFDLLAIDPLSDDTPRGVRAILSDFHRRADTKAGHVYEYQSPNVDVIGWLIECVTGMPLTDFIHTHIWAPLGAAHDAVFTVDCAFAPIATGGFNSTLRDAARFGLAALGHGELGGEQIFPRAWMQDTCNLTADDRAAGAASIYTDPTHERYLEGFSAYRSFWWHFDALQLERIAMGVHGQVIYINPAKNLVIANFASPAQTANQLRPSFKQMLAGTRALAASL